MHPYGRWSILGWFIGLALWPVGSIFELVHVDLSPPPQLDFIPLSTFFTVTLGHVGLGLLFIAGILKRSRCVKKSPEGQIHQGPPEPEEAEPLDCTVEGVTLRSFLLGTCCGIGLYLCTHGVHVPWGLYVSILAFFHFSEFTVTSIISPETLSLDSFLLNHSLSYGIAAVGSWIEYWVEVYYFPGIKKYWTCIAFGLVLCILGEGIRKMAMFTASKNFTHIIREEKVEGHELVTHGIFSIVRHPSYAGWFLWSIGTQILLMNPICVLGYTIASWSFFKNRIDYEETLLLEFFGNNYRDYQARTRWTGVPFVRGRLMR